MSSLASSSRSITRRLLITPQLPLTPPLLPKLLPGISTSQHLRSIHSFHRPLVSNTILRSHRHARIRHVTTNATAPSTSGPVSSQSSSNSNQHESSDPSDDSPPNASAYQKFKAMSKKYGWWAVGVYLGLSVIEFSAVFAIVHALGLERVEPLFISAIQKYRVIRYGQEEAEELLKKDQVEAGEKKELELKEKMEGKAKEKKGWLSRTLWAEIGLAYAIHKIGMLPVRAGLTVAITPKLVKWMTRRGWVGEGGFTRAATHAQGKVKTATENVRGRVKGIRE